MSHGLGLARQQQEVHVSANLPTHQNASVSQAAIITDKHGSLFMVMARKKGLLSKDCSAVGFK